MTPSHAIEIISAEPSNDPFQGLVRVETDMTIQGTTSLHIDPHSRSFSWCVRPTGTNTHDDLRVLRPEDRVTISSRDGTLLFDGALHGVFYLLDPVRVYHDIRGQKAPPGGFLIYWAPKDIDPHTWLSFFENDNNVVVHRHLTALISEDHQHLNGSNKA